MEITPNQSAHPAPPTQADERVGASTGPSPRGGQKRGHLSLRHENHLNRRGWRSGRVDGGPVEERSRDEKNQLFYLDMLHNLFPRLVPHFNKSPLWVPLRPSYLGRRGESQRTQVSSSPLCWPGQLKRLLIVCFGPPPLAALLHIQVCTDSVYRKKGVLYLSLTKLQKHSCHRSL